MKRLFIFVGVLSLFMNYVNAGNLKFTNELLTGKTFYIVEKTGYDTIAKFYMEDKKLKLFYVIFYKSLLDETDTLDAKINEDGRITYTVFERPTELQLIKITNSEYVVEEYHNHSKKPKNTLVLQFSKPKQFAELKK